VLLLEDRDETKVVSFRPGEVDFRKEEIMVINKSTINSYLDELYTINMPYGGDDVDNFIKKNINDIKVIKGFNNKMFSLLENAIIPMNNKGIFHGDLKSANILVEKTKTNIYTRIIDWGLSGIYLSNKKMETIESESGFSDDWKTIPDIFRNRPFQYNVPPSSILFSKIFHRHYDKFLTDNNGDLTHLRRFIKEFIEANLLH
jgi:serine/threonine protein kinase